MEAMAVNFIPPSYHNGSTKNSQNYVTGKPKPPPVYERTVNAWDLEGMNLSGDGKPQHPVLFGCSLESDRPLKGRRLTSEDMMNYMCDVAERHPHLLHVGYVWNYDGNMVLQDLPEWIFRELWEENHVRFHRWEYYWGITYFPGKYFTLTRSKSKFTNRPSRGTRKDKISITVYDYSSFFGGSFIKTVEDILGATGDLTLSDRKTLERGKAERGNNTWANIDEVQHYWTSEIHLIRRVFEKFRDIMVQAGYALKEWYGPGALANYIIGVHKLRLKLEAAQVTYQLETKHGVKNGKRVETRRAVAIDGPMPAPVHEYSKVSFSGGRFETFKLGRVDGPVYVVDQNSAHPFGLSTVPSLAVDDGQWVYEDNPTEIRNFGIYRIAFRAPFGEQFDRRPMPLFWRNKQGLISYPNHVLGKYTSPEARIVMNMPGSRIIDGWYWDCDESVKPWEFLHDLYATRQRLGKNNLLSMPFKLGPNSLYGKLAQTKGWDKKKCLPPKSHSLPIASYTAAHTRASLWPIIMAAPESVVATETDSVTMTVDPRSLNINGVVFGDGLGEWSVSEYEAIAYLQSGMHMTMQDNKWSGIKSRGISRTEFPVDDTVKYLQELKPGEKWNPLTIVTKPRFIGMGAALASDARFKDVHCAWKPQTKEITFGEAGKRRHLQEACTACAEGMTPWESAHDTFISSESDGITMSYPRRLPWEQEHTDEVQAIRDGIWLERESIDV